MSLFSKKKYRIVKTIEGHLVIQKNYGWIFEEWCGYKNVFGDRAKAEQMVEDQLALDAKRMEVLKEY